MSWNWLAYGTVFGTATIKFLFAPLEAFTVFQLYYLETLILSVSGGLIGVTFFYFSSSYLMNLALQKRLKKEKIAKEKGIPIKRKKFTRINKFVVWTKLNIGLYGLALLTPFILSIPIGTIICVKFYRQNKLLLPILYAAVIVCGLILTTIFYFFGEALHSYFT